MQNDIVKHLLMLAMLSLISGCSSVLVDNNAPLPYYPSCATINDAIRPDAPASVRQDWVQTLVVMDDLQARSGAQASFVHCVRLKYPSVASVVSTNPLPTKPASVSDDKEVRGVLPLYVLGRRWIADHWVWTFN